MKPADVPDLESRVEAGEPLAIADLEALAASADLLALGMIADAARRRRHGPATTFVRIVDVDARAPLTVPAGAEGREWRVRDWPGHDRAPGLLQRVRAAAAGAPVTAFSLADVEAAAVAAGRPLRDLLEELAAGGLAWLADAPLDRLRQPDAAFEAVAAAGLHVARLTVMGRAADALGLLRRVSALVGAGAPVGAFAPLPRGVGIDPPTTGYDDVKLVALARLVVDNVGSIQVDWSISGPKLAQVALTFGADDLDGIAPAGSPELGVRRSPLEEVRRNIVAAGLVPVERDGWFRTVRA